jgi:hypothetical protein
VRRPSALELLRLGRDVRKAVPPNLVDFVESAGLAAVAYGPESHQQMDDDFARNFWKTQSPIGLVRGFKATFRWLRCIPSRRGSTATSFQSVAVDPLDNEDGLAALLAHNDGGRRHATP